MALRTAELENLAAELQLSQQKLEQLAYSDALTGLPNRRMFNDCFRRLLALKHRQQGIFALLVIDLDAFKQINDTHGHDAGDAVLMEVARRLERMVRASDCFARVGGDEFFMLLAEPTEMSAVEYVCCRMIESFAELVQFRGLSLRVTVSIGAALYPGDGETQDSLYKSADLALYRVKRNGGNGWRMQEAELEISGPYRSHESSESTQTMRSQSPAGSGMPGSDRDDRAEGPSGDADAVVGGRIVLGVDRRSEFCLEFTLFGLVATDCIGHDALGERDGEGAFLGDQAVAKIFIEVAGEVKELYGVGKLSSVHDVTSRGSWPSRTGTVEGNQCKPDRVPACIGFILAPAGRLERSFC